MVILNFTSRDVSIELFNIAKTIELLTISMIRLEGVILALTNDRVFT